MRNARSKKEEKILKLQRKCLMTIQLITVFTKPEIRFHVCAMRLFSPNHDRHHDYLPYQRHLQTHILGKK